MDLSKYRFKKGKPRTKPYAVPLPLPIEEELKALNLEHNFNVRAWARDLILSNLPSLKEYLHAGKRAV